MKIGRSAEGGQPSAGAWGILSGGQVIGDPKNPSCLTAAPAPTLLPLRQLNDHLRTHQWIQKP
jgi:hypothetical protein